MADKNKINDITTLAQNHGQVLHDQVIDENGPGTILHDFENLLHFIISEDITASGKHYLLPAKLISKINTQMSRPIEIGLKRPLQKSYPHINGLYLLLRASGLGIIEGARQEKSDILDIGRSNRVGAGMFDKETAAQECVKEEQDGFRYI